MILIAICFYLSVSLASANVQKLIFISDIHLDPYYNTNHATGPKCKFNAPNYGIVGCDSPELLVNSTFTDIKESNGNTNSILLFTGDWLRHDMETFGENSYSAAMSALDNIAKKMSSLNSNILPFPSVLTMGNNDYNPNYHLDVDKKSQQLLEGATNVLTQHKLLDHSEAATFRKCAYYKRRIGSLVFIAINTMLYSTAIQSPLRYKKSPDPCGQLAFLEKTLRELPLGTKAIILSHIPPSIDLYNSLASGEIIDFIYPEFLRDFSKILKKHSHRIVMQFYGHTHKTILIADPAMGVPGLVVGAISPIRGNIPSYLTAQYDPRKGYINDLHQRSFKDGMWSDNLGSLDTLLGPFKSLEMVQKSINIILRYSSNWELFQKVYAGGTYDPTLWPVPCLEKCRKIVVCSMLGYHNRTFTECLNKDHTPAKFSPLPRKNSATTVGVILLCVLSFCFAIMGMIYVGIKFRYLRGGPKYKVASSAKESISLVKRASIAQP